MARNTNKLTAKTVVNAKPKDKPYRLSDGGGLYLYVRSAAAVSWEFRYIRPSTSKPTYFGLGSYPDVSLAEARERALIARKQVADAIDPQLLKVENKLKASTENAQTLKHIAQMWMDAKQGSIKAKTIEGNWRKLELYAFPKLGGIAVSKLTAPMAIAALKPLEQKGRLETVKRTAQLLNEIMSYSVNSGLIHSNPLSGIREVFRKSKVEHMKALKPHELTELLQTVATANLQLTTRCLIEWQLHTMARPNEAAGTRWDEIDLEAKLWVIPETRMKMKREHVIPLTEHMIAILEAIKPISGHCEFVFPSSKDPKKHTDSETINKALGRMGFKGRTTAHGLRSLASTTLNEQGFDADVIEAALAHVDKNQIRSAYNRTTYLERRMKLMDWWSNHIASAAIGSLSVTGFRNLRVV
ncbi:integrase family protein [Shewanella baltica OS183]|uniref:integrase domain-containing protein n=1 Tax=Shewanella baltica TaxID=62322 RepID=UPI0001E10BE3|nr:integrase domain-containing protein [Shewanella baltica]AEG11679.1 integrase family protein [Shewanella baltica BA175]EHQ14785.1 integrase family protein [Shewanella baltica OS183]